MDSPQVILEQLVDRTSQLYSLPGVAIKVLQLVEDPKSDVSQLKSVLETDPALTAKILRVVNSALFGLSSAVSDLNQALALLGGKPLKLLVLGFSLPERLFSNLESDLLIRYWRHTLTKAVAARELATACKSRNADEAFIAAMLQDIGIMVLIQQLGEPYCRFLRTVWAHGACPTDWELRTLQFSHVELSARLLERWGLPPAIVSAIRGQPYPPTRGGEQSGDRAAGTQSPHSAEAHEPWIPRASLLAAIVAASEVIANHVLATTNEKTAENTPPLDLQRLSRLGLTAEQVSRLLQTLQQKVEQLAEILAVPIGAPESLYPVIHRAQQLLAQTAADAAAALLHLRTEAPPSACLSFGREHGEDFRALPTRVRAPSVPPENIRESGSQAPGQGPALFPLSDETFPTVQDGQLRAEDTPSGWVDALFSSPMQSRDGKSHPGHVSLAAEEDGFSHPAKHFPQREVAARKTAWCFGGNSANSMATEVEPGLLGALTAAILACRQARQSLSLLLAELHGVQEVATHLGLNRVNDLRVLLERICRSQISHLGRICPYSEFGLGMILPEADRQAATDVAHQILRHWRESTPRDPVSGHPLVGVAVGLASVRTPAKTLYSEDMLQKAERCLFGSHAAGGGVLKSIEL